MKCSWNCMLQVAAIAVLLLGLVSSITPARVDSVPVPLRRSLRAPGRSGPLPLPTLGMPLSLRGPVSMGNAALARSLAHRVETMSTAEAAGWFLVGGSVGLSGIGLAYLHWGNNNLRTAPAKVGLAMIGLGGASLGAAGAVFGLLHGAHGTGQRLLPLAPAPVVPMTEATVSTIEREKNSSMAFHLPLFITSF